MKADLATSIITAIVGTVTAYFVCNIFIGSTEDASIPTIDDTSSVKVAEPNIELFNYKALNPTVEVYVGECEVFDEYGVCLDDMEDDSNIEPGETPEESKPEEE